MTTAPGLESDMTLDLIGCDTPEVAPTAKRQVECREGLIKNNDRVDGRWTLACLLGALPLCWRAIIG